jgi:hypothetical protein
MITAQAGLMPAIPTSASTSGLPARTGGSEPLRTVAQEAVRPPSLLQRPLTGRRTAVGGQELRQGQTSLKLDTIHCRGGAPLKTGFQLGAPPSHGVRLVED